MKGSSKGHICLTHRHRQQCGDGQRERGWGWGEVGKGGGNGDICNSVNNKNKGLFKGSLYYGTKYLQTLYLVKG